MKSDREAVTVVAGVTPFRGTCPLKNVDDCTFKDKLSVLYFLKNRGKNTQYSILEWCGEEKEGRHTYSNTVTSVTGVTKIGNYVIIPAYPATGLLYIINNFLSGHVRMRGTGGGAYPVNYLEMIDNIFGTEPNTIEVCSGTVNNCFTVDINQDKNPRTCIDGQSLHGIADSTFSRWRCDPPYNEKTAKMMYDCELPSLSKLLTAGARVIKAGSLMFLLLGPQNYQRCPPGVKRIGWVAITIVPNNEFRALHIYYKSEDVAPVFKNPKDIKENS